MERCPCCIEGAPPDPWLVYVVRPDFVPVVLYRQREGGDWCWAGESPGLRLEVRCVKNPPRNPAPDPPRPNTGQRWHFRVTTPKGS